jgi:WD40 repeat protein
LKEHPGIAEKLAYSPCGRWIVSVHNNNPDCDLQHSQSVRLWDLHDEESQPLPVDISVDKWRSIIAIAFSSTGSHFAIGNGNDTLFLYDTQSRKRQNRVELDGSISTFAFSPNDQQIAIGMLNGDIYLWDLQSKDPCSKLKGHKHCMGQVNCIAYSPCGEWIASGSDDKTTAIWRCKKLGEEEGWSRAYSICGFYSVQEVAWNPIVPMELVTCTENGSVQVWRISIDEIENIAVKMVWGPHLGILCTESAIFANTIGLSPICQRLLAQRGALYLPEEPVSPENYEGSR